MLRHALRTLLTRTAPCAHHTAAATAVPAAWLHTTRAARDSLSFPGAPTEFTTTMAWQGDTPLFKCFRVIDEVGRVADGATEPKIDQETAVQMYETMVQLNNMDKIFYEAQRQGRISFYMTNYGEESAQVGSSAALDKDDVIYGQYREAGVLMWRGFTLEQFANQCFSNYKEEGKGRQMPIHYGSAALRFQTISSPLGTQLPQAAGAAYALKRSGRKLVTVCYFGDGAASEGDFHAALNMAATLETPTIFFCRNNGYAISTPTDEQYRGDGIAARGPGYGVRTLRVDGNDLLAVYSATAHGRKLALGDVDGVVGPVLIEAMTYRGGHHSTSDDSSRYRTKEEVEYWLKTGNPIARFRAWMENKGWWDAAKEEVAQKQARKDVLDAMEGAETLEKSALGNLFEDVYAEMPQHLQEQAAELQRLIETYPEELGTDGLRQE